MAVDPATSALVPESEATPRARPVIDIIGCGAAMRTLHGLGLRELVRKQAVAVKGCFDLDLGNARAVADLVHAEEVGESPGSVVARGDVQGVVIATPPQSHATLAEEYARAGKDVLVEKPFVISSRDAEVVLAAAENGSSRVLVNHFWRFYPSVEVARGLVAEGAIGEIRQVEAVHGGRWDWPAASDYATANPYGGVLWDTGSHVLDTVLHVLALDTSEQEASAKVVTSTRTPRREPSQELDATARVTVDASEIDLRITLSRTRSLACVMKFFGDRGTLVVPTLFSDAAILKVGSGEFVEVRAQATARSLKSLRALFRVVHEDFLAAISADRPSRLGADSFVVLTRLLESLAQADR